MPSPSMNSSSYNPFWPSPPDPFSQPVTVLMPDYSVFNITMDQLAWFSRNRTQWGINVGGCIGVSFLMLFVVLLLTKPDKRRSPIYFLNVSALFVNCIRTILMGVYVTGPFQNIYAVMVADMNRITWHDKAVTISEAALVVVECVVVEMSFMLQIKAVLATASRRVKVWTLSIAGFVGFSALAFQAYASVVDAIYIAELKYQLDETYQRAVIMNNISLTLSSSLLCLILVVKLGKAVFQRRKLGIKKFGPIQIIFIMTFQTMVIPTAVLYVAYADIPHMNQWFYILLAAFLPMSSLWASASLEPVSSRHDGLSPLVPYNGYGSNAFNSRTCNKTGLSDKSPQGSISDALSKPMNQPINRVLVDIELGTTHERNKS